MFFFHVVFVRYGKRHRRLVRRRIDLTSENRTRRRSSTTQINFPMG